MARNFGDWDTAIRLRDIIDRRALRILGRERPKPRYAYVTSIDRANFQAMVLYEDEKNEGGDPVPASMGAVQPLQTGQRVRVEIVSGDRYIGDVYGPVYLADGSSSGSGGGTGDHPNLSSHDLMGLATDVELGAHASTPAGLAHADTGAAILFGNGVATDFVLNHGLNSRDLTVQIRLTDTPWKYEGCEVDLPSLDTVHLYGWDVAPASGYYTCVVTRAT